MARIVCLSPTVTGSVPTGSEYVSNVSGLPVTGANAVFGFAAFLARASSAWVSEYVPLVSRPVDVELGSATLSAESRAELVTVARTDVSYA